MQRYIFFIYSKKQTEIYLLLRIETYLTLIILCVCNDSFHLGCFRQ